MYRDVLYVSMRSNRSVEYDRDGSIDPSGFSFVTYVLPEERTYASEGAALHASRYQYIPELCTLPTDGVN
jgi:hypothetical protein